MVVGEGAEGGVVDEDEEADGFQGLEAQASRLPQLVVVAEDG